MRNIENLHFQHLSVLGGLIEDDDFTIWVLAARMAEMVYYYGRNGWKEGDVTLFDNLAKRHIITEDKLGIGQPLQKYAYFIPILYALLFLLFLYFFTIFLDYFKAIFYLF